jgi:hypothetical protein
VVLRARRRSSRWTEQPWGAEGAWTPACGSGGGDLESRAWERDESGGRLDAGARLAEATFPRGPGGCGRRTVGDGVTEDEVAKRGAVAGAWAWQRRSVGAQSRTRSQRTRSRGGVRSPALRPRRAGLSEAAGRHAVRDRVTGRAMTGDAPALDPRWSCSVPQIWTDGANPHLAGNIWSGATPLQPLLIQIVAGAGWLRSAPAALQPNTR